LTAKTPRANVKRLQEALAAAQADPIYRQSLARQRAGIGDDAPKWRAIVTAAGIRLG
jgi:hypothetical protein